MPFLSKLVDLVIKKLRSISDVRAALTAVYIRLLQQAWRRLQKGVEDGVVACMERAEDHYVQVESVTLGSPTRVLYTSARYNFGVSQWLGCGRKVKTTMMTATVPLGSKGNEELWKPFYVIIIGWRCPFI